jgi:hypothetical protein
MSPRYRYQGTVPYYGVVFDMTEAKELLQEDVRDKIHETMAPADLQASRTQYHPFKPDIFRKHIHQEVRRQKFLFYLELKQTAKRRKYKEDRAKKKGTPSSTAYGV